MRLDRPRVTPTTSSDWNEDSRPLMEKLEGGTVPAANIFRTLARHPKLLKRWIVFANHVLFGNTLPARERELLILRAGFRCSSGYEWAQHVAIGRKSGLTDAEIRLLAADPEQAGWSAADLALVHATDQLVDDRFVNDATWAALAARWSEQELMDIVFTVGQYVLVSMALNTFGVQIEVQTERFPPELFRNGRFPS